MNKISAFLTSLTFILMFTVAVGILWAEGHEAFHPKKPTQAQFEKIFWNLPDSYFYTSRMSQESWREATFANSKNPDFYQLKTTNLDLFFLHINSLTVGGGHSYAIQWLPGVEEYLIFIDTAWGAGRGASSKIKILKRQKSIWQNVTSQSLPRIPFQHFYAEPMSEKFVNWEKNPPIKMTWDSVQETLTLTLDIEEILYDFEDVDGWIEYLEKEIKNKTLVLKWQDGKFHF